MIEKLLKELREKDKDWQVGGFLGSGGHAKEVAGGGYKAIAPGDDRNECLRQVGYLLVDLACDLGWGDEDRRLLREEVYGS